MIGFVNTTPELGAVVLEGMVCFLLPKGGAVEEEEVVVVVVDPSTLVVVVEAFISMEGNDTDGKEEEEEEDEDVTSCPSGNFSIVAPQAILPPPVAVETVEAAAHAQ